MWKTHALRLSGDFWIVRERVRWRKKWVESCNGLREEGRRREERIERAIVVLKWSARVVV